MLEAISALHPAAQVVAVIGLTCVALGICYVFAQVLG